MTNRISIIATILLVVPALTFAQKKGKVPPYEPVSGVEAADVAPLIFLSLDAINDKQSDVLSDEEILLEEIDLANLEFKTNYIHYVSMMMHRRIKANYSYQDGQIHVELSDIAVQNQLEGGAWEDSEMPVKGDKKIQAKLAMKINELKGDAGKLGEARRRFYGDMDNIYTIMAGGNENAKALLVGNVSDIESKLSVVDADLNTSGNGVGKYMVKYMYEAPDAIKDHGKGTMNIVQYTDSKDATALYKGTNIKGIKSCELIDISPSGELIIVGGSMGQQGSTYDYKRLVDTDPIVAISQEDMFPVVCTVLEAEGIDIHKVNVGGGYITTGWVKVQDNKRELQGLLTFFYDEGKVWPYWIQMTKSGGTSGQCQSSACTDLKVDLTNKINAAKSGNMDDMRAKFYASDDVGKAVSGGENATSLNKKLWAEQKVY